MDILSIVFDDSVAVTKCFFFLDHLVQIVPMLQKHPILPFLSHKKQGCLPNAGVHYLTEQNIKLCINAAHSQAIKRTEKESELFMAVMALPTSCTTLFYWTFISICHPRPRLLNLQGQYLRPASAFIYGFVWSLNPRDWLYKLRGISVACLRS